MRHSGRKSNFVFQTEIIIITFFLWNHDSSVSRGAAEALVAGVQFPASCPKPTAQDISHLPGVQDIMATHLAHEHVNEIYTIIVPTNTHKYTEISLCTQ
jgi:hypothetical protein